MSLDLQLLRDALRLRPNEDDDVAGDLEIEQMGDPAFDWILGELQKGALAPHETVRALRLLARITRQFSLRRKGELMDCAIMLTRNPSLDRGVRSAAVHIAIMGVRIARGLQDASVAYGRPLVEIQAQVEEAVRLGIERGLTPDVEAFAREFLSTSAPGR